MTIQAAVRLNQKFTPIRSKSGNTINNANDGKTSQKIPCERVATFSTSPESKYNQTNANKDVSGIDANVAPKKEFRLANSEIATKSVAEIIIFKAYCVMDDIQ